MKAHVVIQYDIVNQAGYTAQEIHYAANETTRKLLSKDGYRLDYNKTEPQVFPVLHGNLQIGTMTITMDGQPNARFPLPGAPLGAAEGDP